MPQPHRESWQETEGELFRLLVENVTDFAIFIVDPQGRVQTWNPGAQRLLGYQEHEIVGQPADVLFTLEDVQAGIPQKAMRQALQEGRADDDRWHVRRDGSRFWSGGVITPLFDDRGNVRGFAKIVRDRTEWKLRADAVGEQARLAAFNRDVGLALVQDDTLSDMLRHCAEAMVTHLEGAFARVWTLNAAENVLELRASAGMYTHLDGSHGRIPVGQYKIGLIAQERQPHLTNSVVGDSQVSDQEWAQREGMVSFAGYPLVVDQRVVGVMAMFARQPLTDATLEAMASVANGVAVGIERKIADDRRQAQQEWLSVTLASIGDAVIATDTEGRVTFLNGVAQELTGWTTADALGQPLEAVFNILHEQTRQPVENPVVKVLREGRVVGLGNHTIVVAKDGTERPIDDSAAPIRDASGKLIGVILVFRDVTEQRRADRELRQSESRKSAILDTALDCVISMDHQGKIVEFNLAAERAFGLRRDQVIGRELVELIIPPSLRARHKQGMAHYLASGEGPVLGKRIELPALRADGTEFPVEIAITRISNEDPPLFTAYLRDISEQQAAERHRNVRLAVTNALSKAATVEEGARGVLQSVCENLGWDLGFFWNVNESGQALTCAHRWRRPDTLATAFETDSFNREFRHGEGFPGRMWATGKPSWILDVLQAPEFPRAAAAAKEGLHSAFGCPITVGDQTLGVIEFFTKRIREPEGDLLEMIATVAGAFAQFLERTLAQERVRQSEFELADFFENATVGLHWVGPDGTILRANRAELDILGYSREEYVGRNIADFHADEEVIRDILNRLQAGEHLHDCPARLRCKDGSIKNVLIDSNVIFREGAFVHTCCFTRDVTDRVQSQTALREAERRFNAVFNQQFQFMAILSPDGTVLEANETCFRATGFSREQVLGRLLWDTPWWKDFAGMQEQWKHQVAQAAQSGGPVTGEMDYSLADGTIRHATTIITGLKDESGRVTSLIVEGRDDTNRKRNEVILAAQKRALERLVQGAPLPDVLDALCEVIEGQYQQKLIATVLLLDEDGKRLRSVAGHRAPPDYSQAVDGVEIGPSVGSCGTAAYLGEQVVVADIATDPLWADYKDLALRHGLRACWSTPIFSSQGKVLGTFAVYYTSTRGPSPDELRLVEILTRTASIAIERRRDEQALRDAGRRKDEFLATLAHELRNPLAPIRNGLQVLRLMGSENATVAEARSMMERQLNQLVRLVDDLLDMSRITRNKLDLRKERLELAAVVQSAVETSRPLIEQAGHALSVMLPSDPVYLHADATRLAQVLSNLLNNSAKYTEPGGRVSLVAERLGDDVCVRVQDNGMGIPAEALPNLFQMFSQVDHNMERAQGGLGIGLMPVRRLVEMHGGTVQAHSGGPGQGSEFVVRLPALNQVQEDQPRHPTEGSLLTPPIKRRILVVDDNRDSALSLGMMLKLMGNETRAAHDGLSAVDTAADFRPDLILLDIGLPKLNGYDACRRIREAPWSSGMVIVALTGWGQDEDRRRSADAGFDHHLVKPVEIDALKKLLDERASTT